MLQQILSPQQFPQRCACIVSASGERGWGYSLFQIHNFPIPFIFALISSLETGIKKLE
jgi:hypothetical protein